MKTNEPNPSISPEGRALRSALVNGSVLGGEFSGSYDVIRERAVARLDAGENPRDYGCQDEYEMPYFLRLRTSLVASKAGCCERLRELRVEAREVEARLAAIRSELSARDNGGNHPERVDHTPAQHAAAVRSAVLRDFNG